MADQTAATTNRGKRKAKAPAQKAAQKATQTKTQDDALASSSIALAFVLHTIKLHEETDAVTFEKFMLTEVFPSVDTHNPQMGESTPDQHFLLASRGFDEYVWMIRMEYFIHQTPLPNWLSNRAQQSYAGVKDKIESFGTRTDTDVLFDVKEWHQRLGMQ